MDGPHVPDVIGGSELERLCSLGEPNRRRLYDHLVAVGRPITRDEASAALDLDRSLVAYHLDRLVDDGLLTASYARPEGRAGPGAGRPAKRYERAEGEVAASVPPRGYQLAAELLALATEADGDGAVRAALERAAQDVGKSLAASAGDRPEGHLAALGFEPYEDDGVVRLRNCPFHQLARRHTALICGMNLAIMRGLVAALDSDLRPRLEPVEDRCCVAFDRTLD